MTRSDPILVGLYLPLVTMSGTAAVMIARSIWRRWRKGTFDRMQHQILIAVALLFCADTVESLYWGISRVLSQETFVLLSFMAPAVIAQKLFILAAAILSIDAWCRVRGRQCCVWCLVMLVIGMWGIGALAAQVMA